MVELLTTPEIQERYWRMVAESLTPFELWMLSFYEEAWADVG